MIKDKSWKISKLCLILGWLRNLLLHNATIWAFLLHMTKPPLRLSFFLVWRNIFAIPCTYNVTVFYSPLPSNEMLPHTQASHRAHNALVMGCFWTFHREQWFRASRSVRLKSGAQVPECHIILQLNCEGNRVSNYAFGLILRLRLGCSSQELIRKKSTSLFNDIYYEKEMPYSDVSF